jgi:HK97 gp10 family phage protein
MAGVEGTEDGERMTGMKMSFKPGKVDKYLEQVVEAGVSIDAAVDRALGEASDVILEGMGRRAPILTGYLMSRIGVLEAGQDGNYHFVDVGVDFRDRNSILYAVFVEFGAPHRPAQPFLRPTFDEDKNKIRKALRDSLKMEMK